MTTPQPAALPEHTIGKHDHPEPHTMCWSELELAAIKRYAESYALAALQPQPAAAVSDADLYGTLEPTIVSRYVVEKRVGGGFWGYCVKAGDGAQEIFVGHKNACEHVRQALQTACLDGAYMAHEKARAILALRPQAVPMTDEQAAALIDDLSSWADYVDVDHAFETLETHVRQTLAAHGITTQGAQGEQA